MTARYFALLGVLFLFGCSTNQEQAAFLTYLGSDTLAAESFILTPDGMSATVMLRSPETSLQHYNLILNEAGGIQTLEAVIIDPKTDEETRRTLVTATDSGFVAETTANGETNSQSIEGAANALPFLDMIHWPYELALRNAASTEAEVDEQPLLAGRRVMPFEIGTVNADSMTIKHPFRGTMGVTVDEVGRLLMLDAGQTTRKVRVFRQKAVDVVELANAFGEKDAAGNAFGPLSTRGNTVATIADANIEVDFGQPSKRGRDIFGALVPWGEVWRTGANRATHFTTDKTLQMSGLTIPPGTYTLYTIPQPDGGTLMVNTQTNQGGTTYNEDQDLGRVDLTVESLDTSVEQFTIAVEPTPTGGALKLIWDQTALVAPFTVSD